MSPPRARSLALAIGAVALAGGTAHASWVQPMTAAELDAGADRVVDATVVAIHARWDRDHRGLETVVTLVPDGGAPLAIVQPGGELDGVRHVVVGMPAYRLGERARFHLARNRDGVTWRVFGWAQGKSGGYRFATNGMVWPASEIPVAYELNTAGSDDLAFVEIEAAVAAAFATWAEVPCSGLAYSFAGTTDLGVAIDQRNVILFIESGWIYGAEAAGATSLFILDGEQTADVAMNGENYTWAIGPSGALAASGTFDLQAVLTHELGHFSGLGHTMSAHDTMYYSWTPWQGQRSPSLDDQTGLCSIYPVSGNACTTSDDCATGETCETTAYGRLCESPADPIGAACNYDRVECESFCLFTATNLSSGYCSRFCETDADCPLTHHCDVASAGGEDVRVCFAGAQPPPPDAGVPGCVDDDGCPAGQHCNESGACTLECRSDDDCGGLGPCDDDGRCAGADGEGGGCGCAASRGQPWPGVLLALALLGAIAGRARGTRRRRPPHPPSIRHVLMGGRRGRSRPRARRTASPCRRGPARRGCGRTGPCRRRGWSG